TAAAIGLVASAAQAQDKEPIKFATLLDFTAVYTFLTDEYSQGQQDYIKLVNEQGGIDGHPVKLIVRDHGSEPEKGIALYKRALDKGAILFDFLSTPVSRALVSRVMADEVPMLTMLHGRGDSIVGNVFPYVFPAAATYQSQAALLIQYIDEQEGGLEGKKVAQVHIDSPFGREPIPLLETLAERKGYELETFAYASPGNEQSSTWTKVRRFQPDYVIIWSAGPSQAVSVRQAVRNGISPDTIHSVVWLDSSDMESVEGDAGIGVKRFTAVNPGTEPELVQQIIDQVIEPGNGTGDRDTVGSSYYNIGVASMAMSVQAARLAMDEFGAPLTGEHLQQAFEMLEDFDAEGLMPPLTITADDHQGGGWGRVSEWDGDKWVPVSDWMQAPQDIVRKRAEEAAAKYEQETQ